MAEDASSTIPAREPTPSYPPTTAPTPPIPVERREDAPSLPLLGGINRTWRKLKGAPPLPLDDRGQVIQRVDRSSLADVMREDGVKVGFPWRRFFQWFVPVIITVWFFASRYTTIKTVLPMFFIWPLISLMSAARARRGDNVPLALRERMADASLLRAGRCAACGFSLRDIETQHDGCVVCPECSAAWHRDRWRYQRDDAAKLAGRGVECSVKTESAARQVDDRGALLPQPITKAPWLRQALKQPRAAQRTYLWPFIEHLRSARRSAAIWTLTPTVAFVLAVIAMIYAANTTVSDASILLFTVLVVFGVTVVIIARHVAQYFVDIRTIAIADGVCPACGSAIDTNASRDFDGCVSCASCASAWRVDDSGKPVKRHRTRATFAAASSARNV